MLYTYGFKKGRIMATQTSLKRTSKRGLTKKERGAKMQENISETRVKIKN